MQEKRLDRHRPDRRPVRVGPGIRCRHRLCQIDNLAGDRRRHVHECRALPNFRLAVCTEVVCRRALRRILAGIKAVMAIGEVQRYPPAAAPDIDCRRNGK